MFKSIAFKPFALLLFASTLALAQAPEGPAKPLPPGPALPKVKAGCLQCHNSSRITDAHFSRTQWSDELDKMVGLGAVVPDADRKVLLDYLTANFGPLKKVEKKMSGDGDAK
ncbi:MAG: hypothetical protein WBV55_20235 [Candidatus Sulfotelmatobacter sp.]